jgi:hypothetical protein
LNLAGETALIIRRRLLVPLMLAIIAFYAGPAGAQETFPAAPSAGSAFERDACMKGFVPLREKAEERGKLIKAASERHALPDEACRLIGNFGQSEIKMIKYIEANSAQCGIPPQIADQFKTNHKNTEALQKKVCAMAQRTQAGPVGDFDDIGVPPLVR